MRASTATRSRATGSRTPSATPSCWPTPSTTISRTGSRGPRPVAPTTSPARARWARSSRSRRPSPASPASTASWLCRKSSATRSSASPSSSPPGRPITRRSSRSPDPSTHQHGKARHDPHHLGRRQRAVGQQGSGRRLAHGPQPGPHRCDAANHRRGLADARGPAAAALRSGWTAQPDRPHRAGRPDLGHRRRGRGGRPGRRPGDQHLRPGELPRPARRWCASGVHRHLHVPHRERTGPRDLAQRRRPRSGAPARCHPHAAPPGRLLTRPSLTRPSLTRRRRPAPPSSTKGTTMSTITTTERPIRNGVDTRALFATLDAVKEAPELAAFQFRASNTWVSGTHSVSTIDGYHGAGMERGRDGGFGYHADHPPVLTGSDAGPTPVEFLLHALAACLTAGLVNIAAARGVTLTSVTSTVTGDIDLLGILGLDLAVRNGYSKITVALTVEGEASPDEIAALVERSRQRSAVYDLLTNGTAVEIEVNAS